MRSIPGLVVIGALVLLSVIALPPVVALAAGVGFVVMAVLTLSWLSAARKAAKSALAFTEPSSVGVSNQGLTVKRGTSTLELPWGEVLHATKTPRGWIFVSKRSKAVVVLPESALSDAQAGQLTKLLSTWSMRRYRRSPL